MFRHPHQLYICKKYVPTYHMIQISTKYVVIQFYFIFYIIINIKIDDYNEDYVNPPLTPPTCYIKNIRINPEILQVLHDGKDYIVHIGTLKQPRYIAIASEHVGILHPI